MKCSFISGSCVTNPCSEGENGNTCSLEGCISQNGNCVVDYCMRETSSVCQSNPANGCIYNGLTGKCRIGTFSDLEEGACQSQYNMNLYAWVGGNCVETPCKSQDCEGEVKEGCKYDLNICVVDECMKYMESECSTYPPPTNCIYDGILNICREGTFASLIEESCQSIFNGNAYSWVAGECILNPCDISECDKRGCKQVEERCVVDGCMKYNINDCKMYGSKNCTVIESSDVLLCVEGDCNSLDISSCLLNEPRCKNVKSECVENPCLSTECDSPACQKIEEELNRCDYDTCSQYVISGLNYL
jgi:hypothetical protein